MDTKLDPRSASISLCLLNYANNTVYVNKWRNILQKFSMNRYAFEMYAFAKGKRLLPWCLLNGMTSSYNNRRRHRWHSATNTWLKRSTPYHPDNYLDVISISVIAGIYRYSLLKLLLIGVTLVILCAKRIVWAIKCLSRLKAWMSLRSEWV